MSVELEQSLARKARPTQVMLDIEVSYCEVVLDCDIVFKIRIASIVTASFSNLRFKTGIHLDPKSLNSYFHIHSSSI